MKILDIPQSGKRGLNVSQGGRFGQISRALVIPANPRTASQMSVRAILSARDRPLAGAPGDPTGGLDGRGQRGQERQPPGPERARSPARSCSPRSTAPSPSSARTRWTPRRLVRSSRDLAPQNLVIANVAGVITLKLTCPTNPGENTIVRGSAPVSQGSDKFGDFRVLGTCPAPAQGSADITSLYTARYGVPPVGTKVFVRVNQIVDGWEDLPLTFAAIVPAA